MGGGILLSSRGIEVWKGIGMGCQCMFLPCIFLFSFLLFLYILYLFFSFNRTCFSVFWFAVAIYTYISPSFFFFLFFIERGITRSVVGSGGLWPGGYTNLHTHMRALSVYSGTFAAVDQEGGYRVMSNDG